MKRVFSSIITVALATFAFADPASVLAQGSIVLTQGSEPTKASETSPEPSQGNTASVQAADSIPAGAPIEVRFSGSESDKDFITIVTPDAVEGKYDQYKHTRGKDPVTLDAPPIPGQYEIRLLSGDSRHPTLASRPLTVTEVTAEVSGPATIAAGSEFEVTWKGPNYHQDFVTVVPKGEKEGKYGDYKYTKNSSARNPLTLRAPETPGEYELRYLTSNKRLTLASFPFEVTGVSAALKTVPEAKAGETIEIEWEGPDNQGDMITIVPETEREGKYGAYKYTKNKMGPRKLPVVELNAPDEPGTYEVRYVTGKDRFTLAAVKLQVGQTEASVKAPETVVEGSKFAVDWEGPDNQGDMITIVTPQTKEGTYGEYQYTKQKAGPRKLNQVQLTAPEELGTYEVRYVTGGKKFTLSSQTIQVVAASATVEGPEEAVTREVFDVTWEGPGNQGDYIAIVKPDAAEGEVKERAYVHRGKALRLKAPEMEGAYELQYITGKMGKVLAQTSIQIVPSKVPGELKVVADGSNVLKTIGGDTNVSLILDASGSMLKKEQGERRIDVAKKAVTKLLNGPLVDGTPFSLRVFGHKEADSCRTDLEIPLGPLNRSSAEKLVSNLEAKNYAKTPIAKSLELIQKDFEGSEGRRVIILLTDGEETCGGDPAEAIKELAKSGFETRVNIIGFAIDEQMLKDTFQEWARLGNGKYFDAANAQELERSILEAVEVPYEVLDDKQQLIASGVVNGDPISVLPGKYTVKVLSSPEKSFENVRIEPEMTEELRVAG